MADLMLSPYLPLLYIAAIAAVYILLFVVPNRKRHKKFTELSEKIQPHDHVLTVGGILAEVESIKGEFVVVKLSSDQNHMTIHRSAIQQILPQESTIFES